MSRKRESYSREYKVEAVRLARVKGMSIAEAARSLGIHENLLRNWKKALEKEGQEGRAAFPGNGNRPAFEAEVQRLRAENARLKIERDLLKKATALFAREAM